MSLCFLQKKNANKQWPNKNKKKNKTKQSRMRLLSSTALPHVQTGFHPEALTNDISTIPLSPWPNLWVQRVQPWPKGIEMLKQIIY